ncbi:MAG: dihydroorotase [Gammaproteobacteria bacterium]
MNICIAKGRVIDPKSGLDKITNIYISKGKIVSVSRKPIGFEIKKQIDASGQIVFPGLVDLSARLREPGEGCKANIVSETKAAAAGGITTLCCPPDTTPIIDTPAVVELIHQRSEQSGKARVVCLGALTHGLGSERLAEMYSLKEAGCVGVSNAMQPISDTQVMRRALEYAVTCDMTVFIQPQDKWLGNGAMHEGAYSTRMGIPPIPETAETVAIARDLLLIEATGARAHFMRLSTARSVEMIRDARKRGLHVTADVSIHQLYFTDKDTEDYNTLCHVKPPFRHHSDKEKLIKGLKDGVITALCSDHQPQDQDDKTAPFSATEPGVSALDILLPLAFKLAVDKHMNLNTVIKSMTVAPAQILGLESGNLSEDSIADICIFDPEKEWTVTEKTLVSEGKNTPTLGWEMKGKVTHTILNGRLVYNK